MYYLLGEKLENGKIRIISSEVFKSKKQADIDRIYYQSEYDNLLVLIPII